jgi:hypothetical protein
LANSLILTFIFYDLVYETSHLNTYKGLQS